MMMMMMSNLPLLKALPIAGGSSPMRSRLLARAFASAAPPPPSSASSSSAATSPGTSTPPPSTNISTTISRAASFSYPGESLKSLGSSKLSERRILVTGSSGQIGQELIPYLREVYGKDNVIASDVKPPNPRNRGGGDRTQHAEFVYCDVADADNLARVVLEHGVDTIIHNASLLSAIGEQNPQLAIKVNSRGIENVLEVARQNGCAVFAPSTIAVFGPTTPQHNTPDETVMRPTTVYGVTKVYLELLGEYYHLKYGVDFRSMRYPGIVSNKTLPGGGTTDYSVEIFYEAVRNKRYCAFLGENSMLPMMYMPDCLKATRMLLEADNARLRRRTYNITAMSFTPAQLAESIKKFMPEFEIVYKPDFRQTIADSWPRSIDDEHAREDWGWVPDYDLDAMSKDMLTEIAKKLAKESEQKRQSSSGGGGGSASASAAARQR